MIMADQTMDTLGLFCPIPVIMASKKIKQMAMDQVLELLSDDDGIKEDMPAWCRKSGHEFLEMLQEGKVYRVFVRKRK